MLLPSSVSNPASMMAQALTMYKSLVGNVSNDKLNGSAPPSIAAQIGAADSSGNAKDESSTATSKNERPATGTHTDDESPRDPGQPVFTLQSPKERE